MKPETIEALGAFLLAIVAGGLGIWMLGASSRKKKTVNKLAPEKVTEFIELFIDDEEIYFESADYTSKDIDAFIEIIKNETGIELSIEETKGLLWDECTKQETRKLEKALLSESTTGIYQNYDDMLSAYIGVYGNSQKYWRLFNNLAYQCKLISFAQLSLRQFDYEILEKAHAQIQAKERTREIEAALLQRRKVKRKVTIEDVDEMTGEDFEIFLKTVFEKLGYKVEHIGETGDQGGDLIVTKKGLRTVVQAKRHSSNVSNSAIQEVVAAIRHYDCKNALVVTNSSFTKSAVELAKSNNVELWNRNILEEKMK